MLLAHVGRAPGDEARFGNMNTDAPREIHTHLTNTDSYEAPLGGVGEPGVPPVTPALTNAIFAATGKRIRALPIGRQLAERTQ